MKNTVKLENVAELSAIEKLELFNVEELEQRLEMSKWIDTFNAICPQSA
jgi:hypothetical protein